MSSTTPVEISLDRYCEMTVSGMIAPDDREPTKLLLTTPDGCQFRAAPLADFTPQVNSETGQWRVMPISQTDGVITRLQIVEKVPTAEIAADRFECVARTAQVSRKHTTVSLKIDRAGEPTIRPTLLNPPIQVKTGQLWHFVALRVGATLNIVRATPLEELDPEVVTVVTQPALKTVYNPRNLDKEYFTSNRAEMTSIALLALNTEMPGQDWELSLSRVKEPTWEWEAQSLVPVETRARVQVNSRSKVARIHLYPRQQKFSPVNEPETSASDDKQIGRAHV